MKQKKRLRISLAAIILLLLLSASLTACTDESIAAAVVGEYDADGLSDALSYTGAYEIGSNADGLPVFRDTDNAFNQALIDYADGFAAIEAAFDLKPVGRANYEMYKAYGWQLVTEDEELRRQGAAISCFFDIYENSFRYVPSAFATRTCRLSGFYQEESGL